eukprot:TRINITY_DN6912_c0_g1_i1.p1 TRINITY_DN6912_c0_g1~~TRINITY_DN6912_c0_g1_i1.p1  ORF type:complete len:128 (-),score=18.06 TRINITY_DN6912_c0_g1_i1:17-400(-)
MPSKRSKSRSTSSSSNDMYLKLFLAIVIDLIGLGSYLIPGLGEGADTLWAPVSSFLIYKMFNRGDMAVLGFAEEALPFLDFIPTACIAWYLTFQDVLSAQSLDLHDIGSDDDADLPDDVQRQRKQRK